ncbi:hypothetical protein ACLB2K_015331 [Fragaria x ananassa]
MESETSSPAAPLLKKETPIILSNPKKKDFLNHLEAYLAKRDGVDKLLKISRYATKIILASSALPETLTLNHRLKSFESSVGVSRKAFRLGKFVQDVNALRASHFDSAKDLALSLVAYGGEGVYFFVEQFVWLVKSGLIDKRHARRVGLISAWAEFVGDLRRIAEDEKRVKMSIDVAITRGIECEEEKERLGKLIEKKLMKRLSVVQDLADALMAVADIRDGKGHFLGPLSVSIAGLLSALISTHKNWVSC